MVDEGWPGGFDSRERPDSPSSRIVWLSLFYSVCKVRQLRQDRLSCGVAILPLINCILSGSGRIDSARFLECDDIIDRDAIVTFSKADLVGIGENTIGNPVANRAISNIPPFR